MSGSSAHARTQSSPTGQQSSSFPISCATLNVVETNLFKHLIHLALRLQPASHSDLIDWLSRCLRIHTVWIFSIISSPFEVPTYVWIWTWAIVCSYRWLPAKWAVIAHETRRLWAWIECSLRAFSEGSFRTIFWGRLVTRWARCQPSRVECATPGGGEQGEGACAWGTNCSSSLPYRFSCAVPIKLSSYCDVYWCINNAFYKSLPIIYICSSLKALSHLQHFHATGLYNMFRTTKDMFHETKIISWKCFMQQQFV